MGWRLADRIFDLNKEIKVAADIGCNRGFIARHVLAESVQHLYLCDSSPKMLEQAQGSPGLKVTKLEMDEETPTVSCAQVKAYSVFKLSQEIQWDSAMQTGCEEIQRFEKLPMGFKRICCKSSNHLMCLVWADGGCPSFQSVESNRIP